MTRSCALVSGAQRDVQTDRKRAQGTPPILRLIRISLGWHGGKLYARNIRPPPPVRRTTVTCITDIPSFPSESLEGSQGSEGSTEERQVDCTQPSETAGDASRSDARHIVLRCGRLKIAVSGAPAWSREGSRRGVSEAHSDSWGQPGVTPICREATNEDQ
jgi:hypothetical protein